jgi:hypothetical protein
LGSVRRNCCAGGVKCFDSVGGSRMGRISAAADAACGG